MLEISVIVLLLVLAVAPAFAQVANEYRRFLGIDSRKLIWFLAQAQKLDPDQNKGSSVVPLYHRWTLLGGQLPGMHIGIKVN